MTESGRVAAASAAFGASSSRRDAAIALVGQETRLISPSRST